MQLADTKMQPVKFDESVAKALLATMFTKHYISGRDYRIWLCGDSSPFIHITTTNKQAPRIESALDKLIKHNGGRRYCRSTHSVGMLGRSREVNIVVELCGYETPPDETYS